ncbi:DUF3761 domain-containing protein [Methylobacterium sp. E-025]|uniref:DUF3761 domain-containing protein n=1 Tax=Methylobacterium sp. E-025 TaxID=2836561 RepID=UPI001FBB7ED4|nr:DUF3761 domain-containing protein [Methylobacterium sp. E-025]MCJ2113817.1 DUF3761 domain-containing protein [Methylobacterium sp. E-025]
MQQSGSRLFSAVWFRFALVGCILAVSPFTVASREFREPNESSLDRHGHYHSCDGSTVHQPAHTRDGSKPEGASAHCRDGTWSFSHTHRGTCSRHGGVASWVR